MSVTCHRSVVFSGYSGFLHLKTNHHYITKILLEVALNTITQDYPSQLKCYYPCTSNPNRNIKTICLNLLHKICKWPQRSIWTKRCSIDVNNRLYLKITIIQYTRVDLKSWHVHVEFWCELPQSSYYVLFKNIVGDVCCKGI